MTIDGVLHRKNWCKSTTVGNICRARVSTTIIFSTTNLVGITFAFERDDISEEMFDSHSIVLIVTNLNEK